MSETNKDLNIIELLMGIKEDVSSIKTDMVNFKEAQKLEKENFSKEISETRNDYKREIKDLENRLQSKLGSLQTVQNNLVGEVDILKHAEEKKNAKRWKTVIAFIITSIGSMLLVKLPDFISFCLHLTQVGNK